MGRLFDLDNPFFRLMGKLFDVVFLNILALIASIPIITIGPSLTAVYYVALKTVRDEEGYVFKSFVKSFKQNFKQGVLLELILAVAAAILYVDTMVTYNWMKEAQDIKIRLLFYALIGFILIVAVASVYVFPILAKFDNTLGKTLKLSVMMSIRHLPFSILMVAITIGTGVFIYIYPIAIFFAIGLCAFINSFILRRIFDHYITLDSQGKVISTTTNSEVEENVESEDANHEEE